MVTEPLGLVRGEVPDYPDEGYDADGADSGIDGYGELAWPADSRWRPLVAFVGAVVAVGAVATAVIINSGDSASTKATVGPAPRTLTTAPPTPKTSTHMPPPSAWPSTSAAQLPSETFTTVTPPLAPPGLSPAPTAAPAPTVAPPQPALNPRTVIYTVTGTKQLLDLVTVAYTDARGYPQTEFNVSLPWSKVVVLNPGVQTESVIATSFYGRLNCAIVNAAGQAVVASANNGAMATCTR
ncbi:MmpS family transport accessory protein [Mycobacterium sp. 852002-51057_SCH5723018]|uniref:MmpS family transport accessory protein n=1 Tax=Mycobacterium sp. 852002-51057_SCH5723018 TaxID=1834094 RepID=UPI0009ECCE8D|nr:MmpS family transport accessory protein [Mycobacterium sp. 852002-51057_SCH5723018]